MKEWQTLALELRNSGKRIIDIVHEVENRYSTPNMYWRVYRFLHKNDIPKEESNANTVVVVQNQEPVHITKYWDGCRKIRFGLIGDTQLGSKYAQITHLHHFYDICASKGITDVYHTGDMTEGLKMRKGHEYEVYTVSADELLDDVVINYPYREGITTHFISGNHDASIYRHVGYDICEAIARNRPDMHYLGRDCAVVNLTPNCTLELRHPWDGTTYATSYKIQKMVEAMESDSKPNILAVGHYHKTEYLFHRNVHVFQSGCFQGQTPFTRGKGISISMGGWIIEAEVDEDGTIKELTQTFIPIYASIKNDYLNYMRVTRLNDM